MVSTMLKFGPEKLINEFLEQYQYEYGRAKLEKLIFEVKQSKNIESYLNSLVRDGIEPSAQGLYQLLNSHSFFLFAKEETICSGCLFVLYNWHGMTYNGYSQERDIQLSRLAASTIEYCKRLKYNQFNSFFDRYHKRLNDILAQV